MSAKLLSDVFNSPAIAPVIYRKFPTLISLSATDERDPIGKPTGRVMLWIGREPGSGASFGHDVAASIAVESGKIDVMKLVRSSDLVIRELDEKRATRQSFRRRPPCGGLLIASEFSSHSGTLGCAVRVDKRSGFLLSCRHVLMAPGLSSVGDNIYQPGKSIAPQPDNQIATLLRWVPEKEVEANEVDAALGTSGPTKPKSDVAMADGILNLPSIPGLGTAADGRYVRLRGAVTGYAQGRIHSAAASVQMDSQHVYVNQIQYSRITAPGDSGAVLLDASTDAAVGLHFAATNLFSYANRMDRVLELLGEPHDSIATPKRVESFKNATVELGKMIPNPDPDPNPNLTGLGPLVSGTTFPWIHVSDPAPTPANPDAPDSEEPMSCNPVVNMYFCCGEKSHAPGGGKKQQKGVVEGLGSGQGILRFDRFRAFNGTKEAGSGKDLTGASYTPKKTGAPDGAAVPLGLIPDKGGVDHANTNGIDPNDANCKPDEIRFLFTPFGMPMLQKATLKLSDSQILAGYYYRRVVLEYRANNTIYADVIYGLDELGLPGPDQFLGDILVPVVNA